VNALGHLAQQSGGNLLVGGELLQVDGNEELLRLGIDITDINTTLVVEEDPVALNLG
jgi:imidazole glycerol phosphate synthase subunit HisF